MNYIFAFSVGFQISIVPLTMFFSLLRPFNFSFLGKFGLVNLCYPCILPKPHFSMLVDWSLCFMLVGLLTCREYSTRLEREK